MQSVPTDMETKSLRKKFKEKRFAAGCSREVSVAEEMKNGAYGT